MWSSYNKLLDAKATVLLRVFFLFFSCNLILVTAQCGHGLEPTCVWTHEPSTGILWQPKRDPTDFYVELSKCIYPNCRDGTIQSPWLPRHEKEETVTLWYKIYGTYKVWLALYLILDDKTDPHVLLKKVGNYADVYPENWTPVEIRIPATHIRYKLTLKAVIPYAEAMVAVKDINLDGSIIISGTKPTSTSTTSTLLENSSKSTPRVVARISTSTTTTTTKPITDSGDADVDDKKTTDYEDFPEDDDNQYEEIEKRFQALQMRNFLDEGDITKGFTKVVEPLICI